MGMFTPEIVEYEVGEKTFKFSPMSVGEVFRAKRFIKAIGKAIASFSTQSDHDIATKNVNEPDSVVEVEGKQTVLKGGFMTDESALDVELAALRTKERQTSADDIVEALMGDDDGQIISSFICDSLRADEAFCEAYPSPSALTKDKGFTVLILAGMLKGVLKANKDTFSPLTGMADLFLQKMKAAVSPNSTESEQPQQEEEANENTIVAKP